MKRFFKYFFMVILCSCGAEKSNKNNNSSKMALEDLVITRYIKANEISCNYTHGDTDFKAKSLNSDIISGVLQTNFDIIFPKSLSFKIINELKQSSALGIKITSNNFWRTLSRKTQTILNDYLINNFGGLKDKDFDTKRRLTAYAFTIFTEIENYQQAIKIKATSSHLFKDFIVAFSYDIRERLNLKHCLDSSINEVKLPHDQLLPSQIITNVICKDFYDENTIIFKIHKNRKMYLTVDTNIDSEKVQINVDDIHVKESKKYKRISYNDSQYDIDVRIFKKKASHAYYDMSSRSFIYDTIKYLNIDFESKGHQTINLKRLDCKAIKPFAI